MITFEEKVGYGFGDMACSMFWKIFGMYLLFFYTKVVGLSPAAVGTMFLVTRIWDSVTDPVMGLIVDRTNTRWGKYRPYLLWVPIPLAIMGMVMFYVPSFGWTGKLVYAYVSYALMLTVYSAINVPYASLLGVMSSSPKERNILSSYRMLFAFIGSFITFMFFQPLVDFFAVTFSSSSSSSVTSVENLADGASINRDPMGWFFAMAVIGVVCIVLFFLCFSQTTERIKAVNQEDASIGQDFRNLAGNFPWWILAGSGIAALLFNAIRDGAALFYFADYIQVNYRIPNLGWSLATIYFLIGQAANMIGVALSAPLSNKYGKRRTYMAAMALAAILSTFFFMLTPDNIVMILVLQVLISICAGYIFPLLWSMYADIVDYQELKTGRRTTGLIFSSSSMSQKMGWALGAGITGWMLAIFGYGQNAVEQTDYAIYGLRLMMSWLPAISCVLAVVGMAFYPLSEKKVRAISAELEARRRAARKDEISANKAN